MFIMKPAIYYQELPPAEAEELLEWATFTLPAIDEESGWLLCFNGMIWVYDTGLMRFSIRSYPPEPQKLKVEFLDGTEFHEIEIYKTIEFDWSKWTRQKKGEQ